MLNIKKLKMVTLLLVFFIILGSYDINTSAAPAGEVVYDKNQPVWGNSDILTDNSVTYVYKEHIEATYTDIDDNNEKIVASGYILYFVCKKTPSTNASISTENKEYGFRTYKNPHKDVKKNTSLRNCADYIFNNDPNIDPSQFWYISSVQNKSETAIVYILMDSGVFRINNIMERNSEMISSFPNSKLGNIKNTSDIQSLKDAVAQFKKIKITTTCTKPSYIYTKDSKKAFDNKDVTLSYPVTASAEYGINKYHAAINTKLKSKCNKVNLDLNFNLSINGSTDNQTVTKCYTHHKGNVNFSTFAGAKWTTKMNMSRNSTLHESEGIEINEKTHKDCCEVYERIKQCTKCKGIISYRNVQDYTSHDYIADHVITRASCTNPAYVHFKCNHNIWNRANVDTNGYWSKCTITKDALDPVNYPALGHNINSKISKVTKQPTCTEKGERTYYCGRENIDYKTGKSFICNSIVKKESIDALGHNKVVIPAVTATCTKVGSTKGTKCSRCGKILEAPKEIPKTEHKWDNGVVTLEPTATRTGILTYTCKVCKKTKTKTLPAKSENNTDKKPITISGVGTISADGKTLTDTTGTKYNISEAITQDDLKNNLKIADKKSGGKYQIIKTKKDSKGRVIGGYVKYVAPYNKNCKLISATDKVKLGGVTFTVTVIGKNCAKGCKNLRKVIIGKNVTTIGKNAFKGCSRLSYIKITSKNLKKVGTNSFKGISSKAKVVVKRTKLKNYKDKLKKAGLSKKVTLTTY